MLDLNCDLGEGEGLAHTEALMRHMTSANIACGGHAGDSNTTAACVKLAKEHNVHVGAHPGAASLKGRGPIHIGPEALEKLIAQQVGRLQELADQAGVPLHHTKLHGTLYHLTESHQELADAYVETLRRKWPTTIIYAFAGGRVVNTARNVGVPAWGEAFADRAYSDSGQLVPRTEPNALLAMPEEVLTQVREIVANHRVRSVSGKVLPCNPQTICIHSDTPNSIELVRRVGELLRTQ